MSAGFACIGYNDCEGVMHLLKNGGVLANAADGRDDLAAKLSAIIEDDKMREQLGRIREGRIFEYISNYYSLVDTNFGVGSVYDLIRDEDTGKVSDTLLNVMINQPDLKDEINAALIRLKRQMCQDPIIVRDLRPWNVCAQRLLDGSISLKVIDGFGHRFFLPICDYVPLVARKVAMRYFKRNHFDNVNSLLDKFKADRSNKWQSHDNLNNEIPNNLKLKNKIVRITQANKET